jgi:RNA polymerase sigma-70 factor (ECF subfamily)
LTTNHSQTEFLQRLDEHKGLIHKVCHVYCWNAKDKEDLFQEIVVQLWRAWPAFRGDAKFSTWMYRIALNTAISGLRRQKNNIVFIEPEKLPSEISDVSDAAEKEEQLSQMYTAIRELSELERAIVMLYLEDRSYDEMEDILGVNQNNLRVKMNRIKEKLRKLIKMPAHGT